MAIIYVDPNIVTPNDGSDWENAFDNINDAYAAHVTDDEIWVKEGTVALTAGSNPNFQGISTRRSLYMYGCFASSLTGTQGSVATRDLSNRTIITSTIGGLRVYGQNYLHSHVVIDGFDFTTSGYNAALRLETRTTATVRNCQFLNCTGGTYSGGIYTGSTLVSLPYITTIEDCRFEGCSATYGGALYLRYGGQNVVFRRCVFHNNAAEAGSSAYISVNQTPSNGGYTHFDDCIFTGNHSVTEEGYYGLGNVVHAVDGIRTRFLRCFFQDNVGGSSQWGCCVQAENAGRDPQIVMVNCVLTGNTGCDCGGAIALYGTSTTRINMVNCTIADNGCNASGGGGAIVNFSAIAYCYNCIIWGNTDFYGTVLNQIENYSGSTGVYYSDVHDGYTGTGNVDDDPLFAGTGVHPYDLSAVSACVDSGSAETPFLAEDHYPTTDVLGRDRVDYPGVTPTGVGTPDYSDMGAYELQLVEDLINGALLLLL